MAPDVRWPGVMARALGPGFQIIEEGLRGRTTIFDDPEEAGAQRLRLFPAVPPEPRAARPRHHCARLQRHQGEVLGDAGDDRRRRRTACRRALASGAGPAGGAPAVILVAPPPIGRLTEYAEMFEGGTAKALRLPALYRTMAKRQGIGFVAAGEFIGCSPLDGIHYAPERHAVLGRTIAEAVRMMLG